MDLGDVVEVRGKLPDGGEAIQVAVDPVLGISDKDPLEIANGAEDAP
jgi:hypothetical protein